jgi:uncharacterized protein (DUF302 family)
MVKLLCILFLIPITTLLAAPENVANVASDTKKKKTAVTVRTNPFVYDRTVPGSMDEVYKKLFTALENNSYYVISEPNIGKNLSHLAKRWGENYNKNKLESIRSMVFCNAWYANEISNFDPSMLALCPLHITLYTKNKKTHVLFIRPGRVAATSKAKKIAKELEDDVIRTIEVAITG